MICFLGCRLRLEQASKTEKDDKTSKYQCAWLQVAQLRARPDLAHRLQAQGMALLARLAPQLPQLQAMGQPLAQVGDSLTSAYHFRLEISPGLDRSAFIMGLTVVIRKEAFEVGLMSVSACRSPLKKMP